MKLKDLVASLQLVQTWERPKVELEQYPTPPDIAAHMLLAADAEDSLEDALVADLGCGGGILGIGAAMLGAGHVLCVDIDPDALSVAEQNVAEAEVPVDLLACDVLQLAARLTGGGSGGHSGTVCGSESEGEREGEGSGGNDGEGGGGGSEPSTSRPASPAGVELALQQPLGRGPFDIVLMNPPFGTQRDSNGVDMAFLRAGLSLCSAAGAVYSLHKTSTRAFIARRVAEWGGSARVVAELQFEIPRMYKHHKKAAMDVEVDFWRLSPTPGGEETDNSGGGLAKLGHAQPLQARGGGGRGRGRGEREGKGGGRSGGKGGGRARGKAGSRR